jgi:hypothetical protein
MKTITIIGILIFVNIDMFSQTKEIIKYSDLDSVTWDFFKGSINKNDSIKYGYLNTTLQMIIVDCNVWTGVAKFSAYAIVFPTDSWIDSEFKNGQFRNHFQTKYNLSQIYAKKLELDINKQRLNGGSKNKMNKIFECYDKQMISEQQLFDKETEYGQNLEKDKEWSEKINRELIELKK